MAQTFSHKIIHWYQENKRDLPWRKTKDPYKIWLSEIILQQTRVVQGLPYYEAFTEKYPTVFDLAKADEQEVLKLWQGLGYYSRARNLHFTAKKIVNEFKGSFPDTHKELLLLKGIGDYTAAAIASFAFHESVPTVDGNVYRVLARYFGIETPINEPKAKTEFKSLASELIDTENPGLFNQAMMEFGALQCVPASPNCFDCPLNDSCMALQQNKVQTLPVKTKKTEVKIRHFNYLIFHSTEHFTVIQKREKNDIWKHLYEFPLIESHEEWDITQLMKNAHLIEKYTLDNPKIKLLNPVVIKHKLSHQEINVKFWKIETKEIVGEKIHWKNVSEFPFPIIIHKFIERYAKDL